MVHNPIICALDTPNPAEAKALSASLAPHIGAIKLGLEFFTANGPEGIRQVLEGGAKLFLDLKFHDIPNTVAAAVREAVRLQAFMLTVHGAGGSDMLRAAQESAQEEADKLNIKAPKVVAVTVLTSLDTTELKEMGIPYSPVEYALRLAETAERSGLDGIVCSAHELAAIRQRFGKGFITVVPGIRPAGSDKGDQKRVMTPKEACDAGASYLVIGRPITQANNPAGTAEAIKASLAL